VHLPTKFEADEVLLTHLDLKLAPLHYRNYYVRQPVLSPYYQMIQADCCSVDDSTDVADFLQKVVIETAEVAAKENRTLE